MRTEPISHGEEENLGLGVRTRSVYLPTKAASIGSV
jgi:hypothetical protein